MAWVDLLVTRLPHALQRALLYANYLIICAFLVYVIYAGLELAYVSRGRSFQGIPGVSYSWVTMSLPVGEPEERERESVVDPAELMP